MIVKKTSWHYRYNRRSPRGGLTTLKTNRCSYWWFTFQNVFVGVLIPLLTILSIAVLLHMFGYIFIIETDWLNIPTWYGLPVGAAILVTSIVSVISISYILSRCIITLVRLIGALWRLCKRKLGGKSILCPSVTFED